LNNLVSIAVMGPGAAAGTTVEALSRRSDPITPYAVWSRMP
jgi:hypothetical protein